jgi:alpha-mannosidase
LDIKLPETFNLINKTNINSNLVISILKQIDNNKYVIRLFNSSEEEIKDSGEIDFNLKGISIGETNLLEEKIINIKETNILKLPNFKPGEIKTFVFQKGK